jgi:Xaa-Pro aminopeptidase
MPYGLSPCFNQATRLNAQEIALNPHERLMTPISTAELERRWSAVRRLMNTHGVDAIVMQSNNDFLGGYVKWFTDIAAKHAYPRSVIFHASGDMTIVEMGNRDTTAHLNGKDPVHRGVGDIHFTPAFFSVKYTDTYHSDLIIHELKKRGHKSIAWLCPGALPYRFVTAIATALDGQAQFSDITNAIDHLKAIKSPEELALIRETAKMQDKAFAAVLSVIRPGMRDAELIAIAEHQGRLLGSEQGIFLGSSAPLGQRAGFLDSHHHARTVERGDHFTILIENNGAGGLYAELARTVVLGRASSELLDTFAAMKDAQDHTLSLLKPGARAADIADAHDKYMIARGYPAETRLYAHGQGYDLVERPLIRADETMMIEKDMSIVVHPGFANEAMFSVICDNYLIEADGPGACLHSTPKKIFEI